MMKTELIHGKNIFNILLAIMVAGALLGCGALEPDSPDEVTFKGKLVKVNNEVDDSLGADVYSLEGSGIRHDLKEAGENGIFVNEDNDVRVILIANKSITTYKGIKVGDSAKVVEDTFAKVNYRLGNYIVLFDEDNNEISNEDLDYSSIELRDIKAISYRIKDDKIEEILVTDLQYQILLR